MVEILKRLRAFEGAYPVSVFPVPPEDERAKNASAADVLRQIALPVFKEAADEIQNQEEEIARLREQMLAVDEDLRGQIQQLRKALEALVRTYHSLAARWNPRVMDDPVPDAVTQADEVLTATGPNETND